MIMAVKSSDNDIPDLSSSSSSPSKSKKRKRGDNVKQNPLETSDPVDEMDKHGSDDDDDATIWSPLEEKLLLDRLTMSLPVDDTLTIARRLDRIDWEKVSFHGKTAATCRRHWMRIFDRVKKRPTLAMWVSAAEVLIKSRKWLNEQTNMPKKPMGLYLRFFVMKRPQLMAQNPSLPSPAIAKIIGEAYRRMSDRKKRKYIKQRDDELVKYNKEVEKYQGEHPELFGPTRPATAKNLYVTKQVEHMLGNDPTCDQKELRVFYSSKWSSLKEKKKARWTETAHEMKVQYEEDVREFAKQYPDYLTPRMTCILNAKPPAQKSRGGPQNRVISGHDDNVPAKPPSNGYSLYCQRHMKKSEDGPRLTMADIAGQWRQLAEEERVVYSDTVLVLKEEYKLAWQKYVESLPDEEREIVKTNHITVKTPKKIKRQKERNLPKSALVWFVSEKRADYMVHHPDVSPEEVFVNLQDEYTGLTSDQQERFRNLEASTMVPDSQSKAANSVKESDEGSNKNGQLLAEPHKPPKTGYTLFTSHILSLIKDVPSNRRFIVSLSSWRALNVDERSFYVQQSKVMNEVYRADLERYYKKMSRKQLVLTGLECQDKVNIPDKEGTTKKKKKKLLSPATIVMSEGEGESLDDFIQS